MNAEWFSGKAHTSRRRGSQEQAIHYCRKPLPGCKCEHCMKAAALPDCGVVSPFEEYGERRQQGLRTDLKEFIDALCSARYTRWEMVNEYCTIYARFPHFEKIVLERWSEELKHRMYDSGAKPKVYYVWGPTRSGKSRYVYGKHGSRNVHKICMHGGTKGSAWWDGYWLQEALLLDEFRGQLPITMMLMLLDRYPEPMQRKGGVVFPCYKTIYVVSNISLDDQYKNLRNSGKLPSEVWDAFVARFDKVKHIMGHERAYEERLGQERITLRSEGQPRARLPPGKMAVRPFLMT